MAESHLIDVPRARQILPVIFNGVSRIFRNTILISASNFNNLVEMIKVNVKSFVIGHNVLTATRTITMFITHRLLILASKISTLLLHITNPSIPTIYIILAVLSLAAYFKKPLIRTLLDYTPTDFGKTLHEKRTMLRQIFRETPVPQPPKYTNVLHAKQRAQRRAVVEYFSMLGAYSGLKLYHMQPRVSQTIDSHQMNHHWLSDLDRAQNNDPIKRDHMITYMDSCYYNDMNDIIPSNFNPYVIYHNSPTTAASPKTKDHPAHTFINGVLYTLDNGGVRYQHKLWDYHTAEDISYFGIYNWNLRYRAYQVETKRVSNTHAITMILPRVQYTGLSSILAYLRFGATHLKRVDPSISDYTVIRTLDEDKDITSIARQGHYLSVEVPTKDLEHVRLLHENSKMPITLPKIKTKISVDSEEAAMLQDFIHKSLLCNTIDYYKNYKVEYGVKTYQMYPNTAENDPKPSIVPFMNPISNAAYAPAKNIGTEKAAITGRLTKLQQHAPVSRKHFKYIDAFLKRLIKDDNMHTYHPSEVDTVFEKQNRPAQQEILKNAVETDPAKPFINTFVKKEAYPAIKDPRIITTEKPYDKLEWAQFQYPVGDFLKKQPWYMFGKSPRKIARRIAKICSKARFVNCTDFSRMDGRKTAITRTLDLMFMIRLFHPDHHARIYDQMQSKIHTRGCTASYDDVEFFFRSLLAQGSGLPDTSNFNSLDNAFNNFVTLSNMLSSSPTEEEFDRAFQMLEENVALAGDDTLAADLEDKAVVRASRWIGHVVTSELYYRGDPGVNFLARIYGPYVWEGDETSCTDIIRCLSKLHVTTHLPFNMTPMEKLGQKLTSLWYTDEHTPIISQLLSAYLGGGGELASRSDHVLKSYWSQYDKHEQYPNEDADWMWELIPENSDYNILDVLKLIENREIELEWILSLPCLYDPTIIPHKQQTVVTIEGDQDLIGDDSTRVDEPEKQIITLPFIPRLPGSARPLTKLLCKSGVVELRAGRKRIKGKKARKQTYVKSAYALDVLDSVFLNQGLGWTRSEKGPMVIDHIKP